MSTLTVEPFAGRDLYGYDSPSASDTSRDATTHLAVAAVVVLTVVFLVMGVLIRAATGAVAVLGDAVSFLFRLLVGLIAVIVVLAVLLVSKKGGGTNEGPTPTHLPTVKAPTQLLAPGPIR
jgi:hypothetical protein